MNRSPAFATVAALLIASVAACGGDDTTPLGSSDDVSDASPDQTTPTGPEASVEDGNTADGTVAEGSAESSTEDAGPGSDAGLSDSGLDGSAVDSGEDGALADAHTDGATTEAGADAGIHDAAVEAEAGPACTVTNGAPTITETVSDAGAIPPQSGGALRSGTYYLTSYTWLGGNAACAGESLKWTLVVSAASITAGTLSEISESPGAASEVPACVNDLPYATSGANFLGDDGGVSATTYTATQTTITLATFDSGSCGSVVSVFTKQ